MEEWSADFLFGKDLEAVLSLKELDSVDESPNFASAVSETTSFEIQKCRLNNPSLFKWLFCNASSFLIKGTFSIFCCEVYV